jgi:aspartokinase
MEGSKEKKYMNEQMTEEINYRRGYDKGWADAQEYLAKKFEKILSKNSNKSHDKGYQDGANQKDNKPCVCGFWGKSHSNKIVSDWHEDCENGK